MATGSFPAGPAAQMEQAVENLAKVLAAAHGALEDVVMTTTYITPEDSRMTTRRTRPRRPTCALSAEPSAT
jgi:enamine deaminase RidA (YjgF/YER057c/UK114 family)